jgi:hypothetical protein
MRQFTVWALSLSLVGLMAAPACAQYNGRSGLIRNKGVQQELKISDEQAQKIAVICQDVDRSYKTEMSKLVDLPRGPEKRKKIMNVIDSASNDCIKHLADVLTPEQSKRFEQIRLQEFGRVDMASALTTPHIEKALKLTNDQKAMLREIYEAVDKLVLEINEKENPPGKESAKYVSEMRKSANDMAFAVLTDDQKKAWAKLTGNPFEVKY